MAAGHVSLLVPWDEFGHLLHKVTGEKVVVDKVKLEERLITLF